MSNTPTKALIYEGTGLTCMARITGEDGTNVTQAAVSSIALNVYADESTTPESTTALVVSSTIFDALQTDSRWSIDEIGYNWKYEIASTEFPDGDVTYRCEFKFTPASGNVWYVIFNVVTVETRS